jgi:hypothetical protein
MTKYQFFCCDRHGQVITALELFELDNANALQRAEALLRQGIYASVEVYLGVVLVGSAAKRTHHSLCIADDRRRQRRA